MENESRGWSTVACTFNKQTFLCYTLLFLIRLFCCMLHSEENGVFTHTAFAASKETVSKKKPTAIPSPNGTQGGGQAYPPQHLHQLHQSHPQQHSRIVMVAPRHIPETELKDLEEVCIYMYNMLQRGAKKA